MKTAYINGRIFTINGEHDCYENGMFVVDGREFSYIGDQNPEEESRADKVVDLKGKWVMPGLVNTHSHIVMTILRGIGDDMLLKPWLERKIWPLEQQFTPEIGRTSALLGVLEMLKSGTTTFSDMFNPTGIDSDSIMNALSETGIRGAFSHTVFSFGTEEEQRANLQEAERFAKTYRHFADGRLTTMVAPHSPYTCSPEALEECARMAKENGVMGHIHVSETEGEIEEIEKRYGARPVEHILRSGLFDVPTVMAHGVVLNSEERAVLKEKDVRVAHNPVSNLKLGSGVADVASLLDQGIKVGIATDGVASNNNFDMFEEMRITALLQKGTHKNTTLLPTETVLSLATRIGAEALGMPQTGSLEVGKKADFITVDPTAKPHLQPVREAQSHLLYAAKGNDVSDVFVDGVQVVKKGECLTIDEERIISEINTLRQTLKG
ncbi:amidohydrolase family protein [Alteribacter aurantiacus]|uniref:amidohydrolase family protein n=1 Tax=Alteribacter aurantiacus TaxID=254410 RepID=UPI0004131D3F|nr:amidohydrolase family protein [Alteribacter aurantiacus]